MEQLQGGGGGPSSSFMSSQFLDCSSHFSFLQMLNRANQKQEEEEDNYSPHCFFQPEPNMQTQQSWVTADVSSDNVGPCTAHLQPTKKRKRARLLPPPSAKNKAEVERQRMNHIAVERNRRKLMNCHLSTLRSLMPESYVQRGDQSSIIGGAIDFVKQLEQLLMSLQSKKFKKMMTSPPSSSSSSYDDVEVAEECNNVGGELFVSPQYTGYTDYYCRRGGGAHPEGVDVEATMVQGHVNLKVLGRRMRGRRGELVRVVAALEEIGLAVLHLNVAPVDECSVFYCLNLKMDQGCKVGTADEVATAVHQIFSYICACYSSGGHGGSCGGGSAIFHEISQ